MADLRMKLRSRDSIAGLGIAAIGGVFSLGSLRFGVGSLSEMGAGYFPLAAGLIAVVIGFAVFLVAIRSNPIPIARPAVRSMAFVAASIVIFALTIDRFGLLPAIVLCGTICALADKATKPHEALLLAVALAAGIWLTFVQLLGMPIAALAGT